MRGTRKHHTEESPMAMLKVIEVLAESNKSWEDAAQTAVAQARPCATSAPSISRTWKPRSRTERSRPTASTVRSHLCLRV